MGDFFGNQFLDGVHDDGDSSLVVAPEQGRAVGRDDGVAFMGGQTREIGDLDGDSGREFDVLPVVVLVDDRLHVLARGFSGGIDVGIESDPRPAFLAA